MLELSINSLKEYMAQMFYQGEYKAELGAGEMRRKAEFQQVVEERERGFLVQQFQLRKIVELCWI